LAPTLTLNGISSQINNVAYIGSYQSSQSTGLATLTVKSNAVSGIGGSLVAGIIDASVQALGINYLNGTIAGNNVSVTAATSLTTGAIRTYGSSGSAPGNGCGNCNGGAGGAGGTVQLTANFGTLTTTGEINSAGGGGAGGTASGGAGGNAG